jgi:hypothetical protein
MMIIENKFELQQTVYLKTDADQKPRVVTRFIVSQLGLSYELYCGTGGSWHYDFEISTERDVLKATTE